MILLFYRHHFDDSAQKEEENTDIQADNLPGNQVEVLIGEDETKASWTGGEERQTEDANSEEKHE